MSRSKGAGGSPSVITQLEGDWERLVTLPSTGQSFEILRGEESGLLGLTGVADLIEVMGRRETTENMDRHDEILLALLHAARTSASPGDLAARIVVQVLLPGVKCLVRSGRMARFEPDERAGVVLAALFGEVRGPRSPWPVRHVAAQVLGRTADRLRPCRGAAGRVEVFPVEDPCLAGRPASEWGDEQPVNASEELLALLAEAVKDGRLSQEKAYLIGAVRVADIPLEVLAERAGVRRNTIAQRLHRAEAELCRNVSAAA
jgi:hypothetical protein